MAIKINFRTTLQKLSITIILLFIFSVLLLVFRQYLYSATAFGSFIIVCVFWFRKLGEELIVYRLKQNGGKIKLQTLSEEFVKSYEKSLANLKAKGIVQVENGEVFLLTKDIPCTFKL